MPNGEVGQVSAGEEDESEEQFINSLEQIYELSIVGNFDEAAILYEVVRKNAEDDTGKASQLHGTLLLLATLFYVSQEKCPEALHVLTAAEVIFESFDANENCWKELGTTDFGFISCAKSDLERLVQFEYAVSELHGGSIAMLYHVCCTCGRVLQHRPVLSTVAEKFYRLLLLLYKVLVFKDMLSQNTSSAIGALVEKGVACCLRDQEKHEEALLHFDAARRFYELLEASKKDRIPGEAREILQYLNKRVEDDFKEQRERKKATRQSSRSATTAETGAVENHLSTSAAHVGPPHERPLHEESNTKATQGTSAVSTAYAVKPCSVKTASKLRYYNATTVYKNHAVPKGFALIINNYEFEPEPRHGTMEDERAIRLMLEGFGYTVESFQDLTAKQMLKTAKEFARKDHELSHSCIVVVLTHGHLNTLLGTDGSLVDIGQFIRYFQEAPSLIGKPKIFIFQACRGDRRDYGVLHEVSDGALSWIRKFLSDRPVWISDQTKHIEKLPETADVLVASAAPTDYVSIRNKNTGSWFIQTLCKVFSTYAADEDILRLLTRVNREVSAKESATGQKQMPSCVHQLRKDFYFMPGVNSE